jgi:RES domain-containing protein
MSGPPDERSPTAIELVAYRATFPSRDALDLPPSARSAMRYHRRGEPVPLYAALDPDTPLREFERHANVPLDGGNLRRTWLRFAGTLLDVGDPAVRLAAGVSTEALVLDDDYRACYRLMDYARARADALLVPSVAVAGARCLVVWRHAVPHTVTVLGWEIVTLGSAPAAGELDEPA